MVKQESYDQQRNSGVFNILRVRSSIDDIKTPEFWRACAAENLGTFILTFIGFCACYSSKDLLAVAASFGFAGALSIWSIAPLSGGNINPAVSLGLLVARKMSLIRFLMYSLSQTVGSYMAASVVNMLAGADLAQSTVLVNESSIDWMRTLICEALLTFVLVFTVMRLCVDNARSDSERSLAPLAIGLSIFVGIIAGANFSSSSMNPARSFGPAMRSHKWQGLWVFIAGPLIGGAMAGLLQQMLFSSDMSTGHIRSYLVSPDFDRPPRPAMPNVRHKGEFVPLIEKAGKTTHGAVRHT